MAKSLDNFMTFGLTGTIGKLITFSRRAGKTIVGKVRRKSTKPPSEEQLEIRNTFGKAILYGQAVIADDDIKAAYQLRAEDGQSAYNVACADACTPPAVKSIDKENYTGQATDSIVVEATDDFKVARVKVSIHTATGLLVEEGNAVQEPGTIKWIYSVTGENEDAIGSKIKATAYDLPGNEGSFEITV